MEETGKCPYCGLPLYYFQVKSHEGCAKLAEWDELTEWIKSNSYTNCDIIHIHKKDWQKFKESMQSL